MFRFQVLLLLVPFCSSTLVLFNFINNNVVTSAFVQRPVLNKIKIVARIRDKYTDITVGDSTIKNRPVFAHKGYYYDSLPNNGFYSRTICTEQQRNFFDYTTRNLLQLKMTSKSEDNEKPHCNHVLFVECG